MPFLPFFSGDAKATDGSRRDIAGQLVSLALPLLIGNIFQQFYNIASSLIVGRFIGEAAFAAVGVAGSVMNLYIFVLNGACVGVTVVLASLYGGGDLRTLRKGIFVASVAGTIFTLLLSAASVVSLPLVIRAIQTPLEIQGYIEQYLNVILGGLLATFLYNLCAGVLRAVGNTRAALYVLVVSVVFNALLTFVLIGGLEHGIAGAAWATVVSQLLSVVLCVVYIAKKMPFLVVGREDMRFDAAILKKTAHYASVSALHQSSLYIGKMLVQGTVNTLGTATIAAYTAAGRIEGIAAAFADSGGESVSIFSAHKTGARNPALARRGFWVGFAILGALGVFVALAIYVFARPCVALFMGGDAFGALALHEGAAYLRIMSYFYILSFVGNAFVGYFRGSGRINIPFIGSTLQISLRVIFSYLLVSRMGLSAVALATGIGWSAIVMFQSLVYAHMVKRERREAGEKATHPTATPVAPSPPRL
ncbi:polysaccharide biosynthesis C-terminal domain-containing protein [Synergistaceae bacterium OttesenSCG-928-I11]|nr:polysaccharide biosynthesis C-terminal domain-containing protein [Synergistaceae bacterium OttesenSCG-928-I11]